MTTPHPVAVVGDIVAGLVVVTWWLGAYEAHIGAVVTTMAGIYYIVQFVQWIRTRINHDGD